MAINKSNTSPWVKGVIIFIVVCFVLLLMGTGLESLGSGGTAGGTTGGSTETTAQAVAQIATQYTPTVASIESSITAQPKSYDLLLQQAETYYDWAQAVQDRTKGLTGDDVPIWQKAVPYYRRAISEKGTDANVVTDYAVTLFYSQETTDAITIGKQLESSEPTFTPIVFNLGMFYLQTGDNANGKAQLQKYLQLAPKGQEASAAQSILAQVP